MPVDIKPMVKRPNNSYGHLRADDEGNLFIRDGRCDNPEIILTETDIVFGNSAPQYSGEEVIIIKPYSTIYDKYIIYVSNSSTETTLDLSVRNAIDMFDTTLYGEIYTATIPAAVYNSFSATAWSSCFTSIGGVLSDESGDLNDIGPTDVPFTFGATNDAIYFGNTYKFQRMRLLVGTAGVYTATFTWEYWNGSSWSEIIGLTDNTAITTGKPFTKTGNNLITFQVPMDWELYDIPSDPTGQYWIRARASSFTSMTTGPNISQGWYKPVGSANTYAYIVEGLFNGGDVKITVSNNTALSATGGFTSKIVVKEF